MAREIDERVVRMQFENSQFEKNAKESLGTLEKLHNGLDFSGASKGLSDLGREARGFSLDGIGAAVESISSSFSALGVIGITALQNITNKAIDAGTQLVKSLSVDNVAAGWSKLEQKTTSVATLIAQGYDMSLVEDQLNRLNWFTDETSYNFTEMTSNIAKFTASGKGLKESVTAMEGIANWAALSGQNASTASRAMYQISQAMSAGVMRLEDWKSIQNASMDTDEFRQKALDAAVALGTLQKNADGTYESLVSAGQAFSKSQFTSMLTEGKWFTADVMMKTFNDYSAAIDQIYEYAERHGVTASEAIEALGDQLDEFALKAFRASQEAKTWSDVVDSVKDAVSTGWMNTFEIIFGNYEEQRELWTDLANGLYDVFAAPINERNALLRGGLDSGWTQFLREGVSDAEAYKNAIIDTARENGIAIDSLIEDAGSFEKSLQEGWLNADILSTSLTKLADKTRGLSDEELENLGYTRAQIDALEELEKSVKNGTVDLNEYAGAMEKLSGRQHLVQSFWNVWEAIGSVVTPVKEAFRQIFPPKTADDIYRFTEKLRELTSGLALSEKAAEKAKTVASGLFSVLKFGIGVVKNAFSFASKLQSKLSPLKDIVVDLLLVLSNMFSSIGKYTEVSEGFSSVLDTVLDIVGRIAKAAYDGYIWLKEFVGQFKTRIALPGAEETSTVLETLYGILCKILSPLKTVKDYVVQLFNNLDFSKLIDSGEQAGKFLSERLSELGQSIKTFIGQIDWGKVFQSGMLIAAWRAFRKIIEKLKGAGSGAFGDFLSDIKGIVNGISGALNSVKDTLVSYQKAINAKTILNIAIAIGVLAASLIALSFVDGDKLGTGLTGLSVVLGEVIGAMKILQGMNAKTMKSAATSIALFSVGILIFSSALAKLAVFDSLESIGPALAGVTTAVASLTVSAILLSKAVKGSELRKAAGSLITLSVSFAILGASLHLYKALNMDTILKGMGTLGVVLAETAVFSRIVDSKGLKSLGGAILSLSVSMVIMAAAMKILSTIPVEGLTAGVAAISATLLTIAGAAKIMGSAKHLLGVSAAMIAIASALTLLTVPVFVLGSIEFSKLKNGLLAVGVLLAGVTAAAVVLGFAGKNIGGLLAASVAVMAISASLTLLAVPVAILGSLPFATIAQGLGVLLIALIAFTAVSVILAPMGVALLAVAGAFALFGAAALAIGAGLALIAVGFSTLAVVSVAGAMALVASIAAIVTGLLAMIPEVVTLIGTIIVAVCEVIITAIPTVGLAVTELLLACLQVLEDVGPEFIETLLFLLDCLLETIADHVPNFVASAIRIMVGFLEGLAEGLPDIIEAGVEAILAFMEGLGKALPDLIDGAFQLILDFIDGLIEAIDKYAEDLFEKIIELAGKIIEKLVTGLWSGVGKVAEAAINVVKDAWESAKNWLGIASPSKKAAYLGEMFDAGMAKGLDRSASAVGDAAEDVGETAVSRLSKSIAKLRDVSDNMELNPSITPVLDLTDVKSKVSQIGSLLSSKASVSIGSIRDNVDFAALAFAPETAEANADSESDAGTINNWYMTQNNYSPEPLNRIEIYRQTKNQFSNLRELMTA